MAWTQKADYEWVSYSQDTRWYLNLSHAIYPVVKQINLSIDDYNAPDSEYLVYPNPTSNRIIVKAQKETLNDAELILIDLQGRILQQKEFSNSIRLDVQNLESGIYLLSIIHKEEHEVHKVVIQ